MATADAGEKLPFIIDEFILPADFSKKEIIRAEYRHYSTTISGKINVTSNFLKNIKVKQDNKKFMCDFLHKPCLELLNCCVVILLLMFLSLEKTSKCEPEGKNRS